jgi:hypothetical protein
MGTIWLLITILTILIIYGGHLLTNMGYNQLGLVMMLVGFLQLVGEIVAIF